MYCDENHHVALVGVGHCWQRERLAVCNITNCNIPDIKGLTRVVNLVALSLYTQSSESPRPPTYSVVHALRCDHPVAQVKLLDSHISLDGAFYTSPTDHVTTLNTIINTIAIKYTRLSRMLAHPWKNNEN